MVDLQYHQNFRYKRGDSVVYFIYIYFFFRFFSLIGYYKILTVVPCAVLVVDLLYI